MAQRLFQSIRKIPNQFTAFRKRWEVTEVQGVKYKINNCSDYGFPSKPTSIAYDHILDMLAVLTREGILYIYGKPGIVFSSTHNVNAEFIQVYFLVGSRKLITLTDCDDMYLWELASISQSICLIQRAYLKSVTHELDTSHYSGAGLANSCNESSHITALCCSSDNRSILVGTDSGWVASIRMNTNVRVDDDSPKYWHPPSLDDAISPGRILSSLSDERRQRLRIDTVVVLFERPGFPGQLLIGYSSGLTLVFDFVSDRLVALLPWQHGLEAASWCGGSGLPPKYPTESKLTLLGTRLLTAHSDGSLGVWNLKDIGFALSTAPTQPVVLTMEEAPSMPYGPFPCKLISKVFWLPSSHGGITVFVGGMPRTTYGDHHTVSVLRGSNIDHAATANVVAARLAAAAEAEDDDELPEDNTISLIPIHIFDSDAPEHVCFDLSSNLVDVVPVGHPDGVVQMLLLLCEDELVAVDLVTPGWPFMRPPYLTCLHTTPLITYNVVTQVNSTFLTNLEAAGAYYGPEGKFGRSRTIANSLSGNGWSSLPWPIKGGSALINGSRLSTSTLGGNTLYTDDLLLTGHEDGSVAFWRMSAGGVLRRIYTLNTAVLFDGDFAGSNNANGVDDDGDAWPPFRLAGLFDPFMDDCRVAVQIMRLVDNTVVVGGAAGQISVWQFLHHPPPIAPANVVIKSEMPGFQWKGHNPLNIRSCFTATSDNHTTMSHHKVSPPQLQATGVVLIQPPGRVTALQVTELDITSPKGNTQQSSLLSTANHLFLALGTPHGYGLVFFPKPHVPPMCVDNANRHALWKANPPQTLLAVSTIPDNTDAMQDAAAGEGWARRRTRELKKSLRDSFRRLKRVRSTKSFGQSTIQSTQNVSRAGIRRTVTQSRHVAPNRTDMGPLDEAERRLNIHSTDNIKLVSQLNTEREICDRPQDSANVAIVSCFTFGPPLFRPNPTPTSHNRGSQKPVIYPFGSLFIGTKAGTVKLYSLFTDKLPNSSSTDLPVFSVQYSKELILQHGAPVVSLRLIDNKSNTPLSVSNIKCHSSDLSKPVPTIPALIVVSEEQVRLFGLPNLRLKYKARITATDGFRIKAVAPITVQLNKSNGILPKESGSPGSDMDRSTTNGTSALSHSDKNIDYSIAFTNMGGQAVILNMPYLKRMDTLRLIDANDVIGVSSTIYSEPGCSDYTSDCVKGPSLGMYQLAPGQLSLFDIVRTGLKTSYLGASYRPIYRLPLEVRESASHNVLSNQTENIVNKNDLSNKLSIHNNPTSYHHNSCAVSHSNTPTGSSFLLSKISGKGNFSSRFN